jgi:hypothetical protein
MTKIISILALSLLFITGCNNNDDPEPAPGIGGSMSATIDGAAWAATSTSFNKSGSLVEISGERNPTGNNPTAIGIQLNSYSGVSNYTFGSTNNGYLIQDGLLYTSDTGNINVTQDDGTWFKASFSFSGTDSLNTETKTVVGTFTYRKQ